MIEKVRIIRYVIYILTLIIGGADLSSAFAQKQTTFNLSVQDEIYEGEKFKVSFTVNAGVDGSKFKMEDPSSELTILYGPSLSTGARTVIVNGNREFTQYTTFTYVFLAEKAGEYVIPEASVVVGTEVYKTKSQKVTVFPTSARASNSQDGEGRRTAELSDADVFVTATASKSSIYEQEGILVTFKIYTLVDIKNVEDIRFANFDGFISQAVPMPSVLQLNAELYKGKAYRTAIVSQVYLFPQRTGQLSIPSGSVDVLISIPVQADMNTPDGFFRSFFSSYQNVRKTLKSRPISIQVSPLPSPKPDGFSGAVGTYSLSAELPRPIVKSNESLQVRLDLKGEGNIKLVQIPTPLFPDSFESYDPKEDEDIEVTTSGVKGSKSKEFFVVPRTPGDYTIPAMDFVYFDPNAKSYKSIKIGEMKVHVDKGDQTIPSSVANFSDKQDVTHLGQDIRYIKVSKSSTYREDPHVLRYALGYLMIILIAVGVVFVSHRKQKEEGDLAGYRRKRAGRHAKRWLKLAVAQKNEGNSQAYFDALLNGLSDYLSSKLQIPLSVLSKDSIRDTMQSKGVDAGLIDKTLALLSTLELTKYAPVGSVSEKDQLYNECVEIIETLETQKI